MHVHVCVCVHVCMCVCACVCGWCGGRRGCTGAGIGQLSMHGPENLHKFVCKFDIPRGRASACGLFASQVKVGAGAGIQPRVAMLSYATGSSNTGPIIDKARAHIHAFMHIHARTNTHMRMIGYASHFPS